MKRFKVLSEDMITYKGQKIGIFRDEYGTELNFIDEMQCWEPIPSFCYISEESMDVKRIIKELLKCIDSLENDIEWWNEK